MEAKMASLIIHLLGWTQNLQLARVLCPLVIWSEEMGVAGAFALGADDLENGVITVHRERLRSESSEVFRIQLSPEDRLELWNYRYPEQDEWKFIFWTTACGDRIRAFLGFREEEKEEGDCYPSYILHPILEVPLPDGMGYRGGESEEEAAVVDYLTVAVTPGR